MALTLLGSDCYSILMLLPDRTAKLLTNWLYEVSILARGATRSSGWRIESTNY